MINHEALWVRCAEMLFSRGKSFEDALAIADRITAIELRRAQIGNPGLAKCDSADRFAVATAKD